MRRLCGSPGDRHQAVLAMQDSLLLRRVPARALAPPRWPYIHIRSRAARVLGDDHPLTVNIDASMKLCCAEQLDWTLDDFPADVLTSSFVRKIVAKYR